VGSPITLDAGNPGLTFHWSNGANTETISPNTSGQYSVTVSNANSCPGYDTINITFMPYPVVHLGNDTAMCIGNSLILNAGNTGLNYLWSTGAVTQTITVNTAGSYSVTVTSLAADCTGSDTINIIINPLPVVTLGNDTSACIGQPITLNAGNPGDFYHWSNGSNSQTINPTITGNYSVTVNDANGCKNSDTVFITFIPYPIVNLGPDQIICSNVSILLYGGSPATSYLWQDGSTSSSFLATTGGTYWVITANQNCIKSDTIILTPVTAPPVTLGPDIRICFGQDTALTATTPATNYLWNTGATTQRIAIFASGEYWVKVSWEGCNGYDTANVFIDKQIILNLGDDTTICPGDTMSITPGNQFIKYEWLPGQQISPTIIINQPGTYIVTVTDSNNCLASGSRWVADYCQPEIFVPNTFTPNGNGLNENFLAYGVGIIYFHMYVFDRWGELLFESSDISQGWDGYYMGNPCQQDIYVYRIDYKLYDSTELKAHTIYGNVNLIR
jgi:gliding motility-associated-like protein